MLRIKEYVKAASLEEAYELNQKRSNRVLGGMLWMRMSDVQVQKAIDLSGLGLDQIEETEDAWKIGYDRRDRYRIYYWSDGDAP